MFERLSLLNTSIDVSMKSGLEGRNNMLSIRLTMIGHVTSQ